MFLTGDNSNAVQLPHGNSKFNTQPHRPRLPGVNQLAKDILDKHPSKTAGDLYKDLSQSIGPGLVGILSHPRNRRAMQYQKEKHDKEMNEMAFANIGIAEEEAGGKGTLVRRLDVHTQDAGIMVLVDNLMIEEVMVKINSIAPYYRILGPCSQKNKNCYPLSK